jgi:hypothetical protein
VAHYDVFNGDADGLCALQQLRLADPKLGAHLITGVKRDVRLLERVSAQTGDSVTVLDVSLAQNRAALLRLLEIGATVEYFDHHGMGAPIEHPGLRLVIDLSPEVCTSLLVDRVLQGHYAAWAIVGAFGDGLVAQATRYAQQLGLNLEGQRALRSLGEYLNYNSYGDTESDLWFHPLALCERIGCYRDPLDFIQGEREIVETLAAGYLRDLAQASTLSPTVRKGGVIYLLPESPWTKRISGMLATQAQAKHPERAVAVIRTKGSDRYTVSVRVPRQAQRGADQLCRQFPTGGGRFGAAGINELPQAQLGEFLERFDQAFAG